MTSNLRLGPLLAGLLLLALFACGRKTGPDLREVFLDPPHEARPWVIWHWINAAVSREGITADLEAMKQNGIAGAYLISVRGATDPPLIEPSAEQLSPEWWALVEHAFREAERLDLELAMHACDGFTVAGGPWITEEMSMQKVVWSEIRLEGEQRFRDTLPRPDILGEFYRDIAILALPVPDAWQSSAFDPAPLVTSSMPGYKPNKLLDPANEQAFRSKEEGWILFSYPETFTLRSLHVRTPGLSDAANRLWVECSDDGIHFREVCRLRPPRHGWQDYEAGYTHAIPETRSRYFRFRFSREGTEPGSEDLESAKWTRDLKLLSLVPSSRPFIPNFRGKNGSIWRIGERATRELLPDSLCIPFKGIIDLSGRCTPEGYLDWEVPEGSWILLRMGHCSTGHMNYTGGRGMGLECDKLNGDIAAFQFDQWFGKAFTETDPDLAAEVLKGFFIDSWECGSQNWTPGFEEAFFERRGYVLRPCLPLFAGIPLERADMSERILFDIRKTLDELLHEGFFGTMARKAGEKGCIFSSESLAPVMQGDALTHYGMVDIPMGEFWHNSPTHDKPNDMLDAISAARIYGKNVVRAEAFTTLRMDWNEHPAALKTLGDRNMALGVNSFAFHVFAHNPWTDRSPGMTLGPAGLFFQRDQTWWEGGKAWIDYISRCQALLQEGDPVADLAVFTGGELPRRALTPDRLIDILPGLFSPEQIAYEMERRENAGNPRRERPHTVNASANIYDPAGWIDPLGGYAYDSFNKDALLKHARVVNKRVCFAGGTSYAALLLPGPRRSSPSPLLSGESAAKILELVRDGATVIIEPTEAENPGLWREEGSEAFTELYAPFPETGIRPLGKGRIVRASAIGSSLERLDIERDLVATSQGGRVRDLGWTHREGEDFHIYFISNQSGTARNLEISLRHSGADPLLFDPLSAEIHRPASWKIEAGRTKLQLELENGASIFVVFDRSLDPGAYPVPTVNLLLDTLAGPWQLRFDTASGGISGETTLNSPLEWTSLSGDSLRYYSGTATYSTVFRLPSGLETGVRNNGNTRFWLDLGEVSHLAKVIVNGIECGTAWTAPYRVDISRALRQGTNQLEIRVTNTWKNRIIGDHTTFRDDPLSFTTAPFNLQGHEIVPSGLGGPVSLQYYRHTGTKWKN